MIDFDDAGFGWHAYDFAVALHGHEAGVLPRVVRRALIEGYRQVRPVSDETVALIPLFLLIRTLASIGWTAARRNDYRTMSLIRLAEMQLHRVPELPIEQHELVALRS